MATAVSEHHMVTLANAAKEDTFSDAPANDILCRIGSFLSYPLRPRGLDMLTNLGQSKVNSTWTTLVERRDRMTKGGNG